MDGKKEMKIKEHKQSLLITIVLLPLLPVYIVLS